MTEGPESFVPYGIISFPDLLKDAFVKGTPPGALSSLETTDNEEVFRTLFVNSQWALGGARTGAPVSSC